VTVYDIKDVDGRVFAFEINNFPIGRRGVRRVLERIPGCRLVRGPKRFLSWFREDEFCEFEVEGIKFVVAEPYGDNSRYWIGPEPTRWVPQIAAVRDAFLHSPRVPPLVRVALVVLFVVVVGVIATRR
jgi:hypothetical protein